MIYSYLTFKIISTKILTLWYALDIRHVSCDASLQELSQRIKYSQLWCKPCNVTQCKTTCTYNNTWTLFPQHPLLKDSIYLLHMIYKCLKHICIMYVGVVVSLFTITAWFVGIHEIQVSCQKLIYIFIL